MLSVVDCSVTSLAVMAGPIHTEAKTKAKKVKEEK